MIDCTQNIIEILDSYKIESKFKDFIVKVFLYKNKLPVIEFSYKTRTFAFDVSPLDNDNVRLDLKWREGAKHYNYHKQSKVITQIKDITDSLDKQLVDVFEFLDKYANILVSVIIPMYNREKIIIKLIETLNNQTLNYDSFEAIFIDDASTDGTIEIVKNLTKCNYRIIERKVRSGNASAPRNEGILEAKGDYILCCDSDDYIAEYTLEEAVAYAKQNKSDCVYLKLDYSKRAAHIHPRVYKGENVPFASIYKHYLLTNFAPYKMVTNYLLRFYDIKFDPSLPVHEDMLFVINVVSHSRNISILREKDYMYCTYHDGEHLCKRPISSIVHRKVFAHGLISILGVQDIQKKVEMYNSWYYRFSIAFSQKIKDNKLNANYLRDMWIIISLFEAYNTFFDNDCIHKNGLDDVKFIREWFYTHKGKYFL